ncbi:MAG: hypothetical protein Q8P82_03045 [bacterium]|nr:hypothetical protein [bacterium]
MHASEATNGSCEDICVPRRIPRPAPAPASAPVKVEETPKVTPAPAPAATNGGPPIDSEKRCEWMCKRLGPKWAKWVPDNESGNKCRPADGLEEQFEAGRCVIVPLAGVPSLPSLPGEDGEDGDDGAIGPQGQAGLSCWDLNGNGTFDQPEEDTNLDGHASALDCRGRQGRSGRDGANGVSVTVKDRCEDHGGTWLDSTGTCQCAPGFVTAPNGIGCVPEIGKKDLLDLLHLHPLVQAYAGGFFAANGTARAPFYGGAAVGGAFDVVDDKLQLVLAGGVVANGGERPLGTFVYGDIRWWPVRHFGLVVGAHGHFLGTNRLLSNQLAEVGGQFGLALRAPLHKRFTLVAEGKVLIGDALPYQDLVVGGVGTVGFYF